MPKEYVAERLLALFTSHDRAAVMVGDLLELYGGHATFWLAVLRTTWALSWRLGLGFLLAVSTEFYCLLVVNNWAARPPHGVDGTAILSGWCFTLFAAGAVFSLVRFGVFDTLSRVLIALALLSGLDLCFWWMPFMRLTGGAMTLLIVGLCCLTREGRLALRRVLGAMIAAFAPLITLLYLVTRATAEQCRQGCSLNSSNAPVLILLPVAFLLSGGMIAGVLGRHRQGRILIS